MEKDTALQTLDNEAIRQLMEYLSQELGTGSLAERPPAHLLVHPAVQEFILQINTLQQFAMALANGNLEPELHMKGRVAGALKMLQGNLRHLTWQAKRIAEGDLNQRVAFMGDFAEAFNKMVEYIRLSRQELEQHAQELQEQHRAAVQAMKEAENARDEARKANELLQQVNQRLQEANQQLEERLLQIQHLQAELREQAIRDPLTGCFNRRYLEETLEREFSRALREGYQVSVVMVDIDHFKRVNDRYGHAAGDRVLQALAHLLQNQCRAGDIVCRYGGEEFLMVLPGMSAVAAFERADQWRKIFQELAVPYEGKEVRAAISLGVAVFPLDAAEKGELIRLADEALYRAKDGGRNQVRMAPVSQREVDQARKRNPFW